KPERLASYSPGQRPGNESSPTILRPVRAKADVCCYALQGAGINITQFPGVALGCKMKGFQP
ncbi:hypothetical protein DXA68_20905, partial [Bacteroides stercorirosoris]